MEKRFLNDCGIATAAFRGGRQPGRPRGGARRLRRHGVLKTRRLGYDGKGQRMFRSPADSRDGAFAALGSRAADPRRLRRLRARNLGHRRARAGRRRSPATIRPRTSIATASCTPRPCRPRSATATADQARARPRAPSLDRARLCRRPRRRVLRARRRQRCWPTRSRRACTIPATGRKRPASISQFEQHIRAVAGLPLGDPAPPLATA